MHIGPPDFDEHYLWGVSCFDFIERGAWSDGTPLGISLDEHVDLLTEGADLFGGSCCVSELPTIAPSPSGFGSAIVVVMLWTRNSVDAVLWVVSEAARLGLRIVVVVAFDWRDWGVVEAAWEDLDGRLGASIERHVIRSKPHPGDEDNHLFYAAWEANQLLDKLMRAHFPPNGD